MRAQDANRRVRILPNQLRGLRERVGLSKAEVDRAVWALTRDGERYEGAAALNAVLRELPRWAWLARWCEAPLIYSLESALYRWVAANRHRLARWFSATPACAQTGADCIPEGE